MTLAISALVFTGVYSVFESQYRSYIVQERVAAMQQNLRTGFHQLEKGIRLAGFDPTWNAGSGFEFDSGFQPSSKSETLTMNNSITLSYDLNRDGDVNENDEKLSFYLYVSATTNSVNLGMKERNSLKYVQTIAENIDAINFIYLDSDNNPTVDLNAAQSVQVSMVARSAQGEQGFVNSEGYANMQGDVFYTAPGDGRRRRQLSGQVRCRNIGLF